MYSNIVAPHIEILGNYTAQLVANTVTTRLSKIRLL